MSYNFKLPKEAHINKFVAKNKFYEKGNVNTKLKQEFVNKIQKISWKYKLSENTIGISKTKNVTEIQVFEIELKQKDIPKNALKLIANTIQYHMLFYFTYKESNCFAISYKNMKNTNYYYTEWNQEIDFNFTAVDLEKVYQNIIRAFIGNATTEDLNFNELIRLDTKIKELQDEISNLKSKIKNEKQFNRKVELNKLLLEKKQELKIISKK